MHKSIAKTRLGLILFSAPCRDRETLEKLLEAAFSVRDLFNYRHLCFFVNKAQKQQPIVGLQGAQMKQWQNASMIWSLDFLGPTGAMYR